MDEKTKAKMIAYQRQNLKKLPIALSRIYDADIIEWLAGKDNVRRYVLDLIRADMAASASDPGAVSGSAEIE